jgi:hypothetical protein
VIAWAELVVFTVWLKLREVGLTEIAGAAAAVPVPLKLTLV